MHFLGFALAQPRQRKGSLFVAKPLMFLFTGKVLGKTCGMQPRKFCSHCPLSGQGPARFQVAFVPQKAESLFVSWKFTVVPNPDYDTFWARHWS